MKALITLLDRYLGRCSRCMGQSFAALLCMWIATLGASTFHLPVTVLALLLAAALLSTLLWIAHVVVFAARISVGGSERKYSQSGDITRVENEGAVRDRRSVMAHFARATALAALTTISVLPSTVFAAGKCDCSKCRSNQFCCPTANGYCGCFPMKCP